MGKPGGQKLTGASQRRERPVFVSADGRRSTAVKWLAHAIAAALAAWLIMVVVGGCAVSTFPRLTAHAPTTAPAQTPATPFSTAGPAHGADGGSTP
jgi:hypothetical protein